MMGCGGKREQEQRRDRRNLLIARDGQEAWSEGGGKAAFGDNTDAAAACQLVIAGCTSETAKTEEGEHTIYCLRCVMVGCKGKERLTWEVRRRYREFYSLHTRMKAYGSVHADLPSRNPFALMSSVIHAREKGLQEYLNQVLERCSDDQCHLLAKFLQVNKHMNRTAKGAAHSTTNSTPASSRAETPDVGLRTRAAGTPSTHGTPGPIVPVGMVPKSSAASAADRKRSQSCPRGATRPERTNDTGGGVEAGGREGGALDDSALTSDGVARGAVGASRMAQQQQLLLTELRQQRAGRPVAGGGGGVVEAKAGVGLFFVENDAGLCEVDEIICGSSADADGSIQVGDTLHAVDGEGVHDCDLTKVRERIIGPPDSLVTLSFERPRQYQPVTQKSTLAPHRYDVTLVRSLRRAPSTSPSASGGAGLGSADAVTPKTEAQSTPRMFPEVPEQAGKEGMEGPSPVGAKREMVLCAERRAAAKVMEGEKASEEHSPSEASEGERGRLREHSGQSRGSGKGVGREGSEVLCTVKAVCAFNAQKPHELSLQPGELVIVLRRHASGWWEGCTVKGGRRGWLPSNHVQAIDSRGIVMEQALRATTFSERTDLGEGAAGARESQTGSTSSGQSLSVAQTVMANLSTTSADSLEVTEMLSKKNVQDWGVEEVCSFLAATELGEYTQVFRANKIDGELLSELQDRDLLEDFGITNKYHRRRLLKRLHG